METYDGPLPKGFSLTDTAGDINDKVNIALRVARGSGGSVSSPALEAAVYKLLGTASLEKIHLSAIEVWAMALPRAKSGSTGKIYRPNSADSQYKDDLTIARFGGLAPVMLVNGILIGTDKLGHFFQISYSRYYSKTLGPGAMSRSDAITEGDKGELGKLGIGGTGVYSHADNAANQAGLKFYEDLARTPNMVFDIRSYISNAWNEQANPNQYGKDMVHVWRRNIPGLWSGEFIWKDGSTTQQSTCQLFLESSDVSTSKPFGMAPNQFEGTYTYNHPLGMRGQGKLTGKIREIVNSDGIMVRIEIDVEWTEGTARGKGNLVMTLMNLFVGTWGRLDSVDNGGTWSFLKA